MKIGIIGTGTIGSILASKLVASGHKVKVNNRSNPDVLAKTAHNLGAMPASIQEIVKDVDVIIVSVPTNAIPQLPKDLFKNISNDVIVVDTSNYYPFRDGEIKELKDGKVESVWVSEQLGHPVIKAFNNLLAYSLSNNGKNDRARDRIAMAISGDNENEKKTISELINDIGFDVVDAGSLDQSWRHQPGTPAYCTELNVADLKQALADAVKEDTARLRDSAMAELAGRVTPPSHEDTIKVNRSLFPKNPQK